MLYSVTKRLYPAVAKRFETTDRQVERAIRSTIETAWLSGNSDTLVIIFGELFADKSIRPTNSEVIKTLTDNVF